MYSLLSNKVTHKLLSLYDKGNTQKVLVVNI